MALMSMNSNATRLALNVNLRERTARIAVFHCPLHSPCRSAFVFSDPLQHFYTSVLHVALSVLPKFRILSEYYGY